MERGWCQRIAEDRDGSVCALGGVSGAPGQFRMAVFEHLRVAGDFRLFSDLTIWNDAFDRTQADVIALYDRAIAIAVAEELYLHIREE